MAETDDMVLYFGCYTGKTLLELWNTTPWYISLLYTQLLNNQEYRELPAHLPCQWTLHHSNHYLSLLKHWIKKKLHSIPMDVQRLDEHDVRIDRLAQEMDLLTLVVHGPST
jgi:hypothetical protein